MPIALLMNFHQRSGKFPSPLWGGAGVGVGVERLRDPRPTLPHKGGGSRSDLPLVL